MISKIHSSLTFCVSKYHPPVFEDGISKRGPRGVTSLGVKHYNHPNKQWTWKGLLEEAAVLLQSVEKHADTVSLGLDIWSQTPRRTGLLAAVLWNQEWRLGEAGSRPWASIHQADCSESCESRADGMMTHAGTAGQISHSAASSAAPAPSIPPWPNPRDALLCFEHGSPSSQFVVVISSPESRFLSGVIWQRSVDVVLMSAPFWIIPLQLDGSQGRRNEENPHTKLASYPGQEDEWISQVPSNVEFHNWIISCDCTVILGICKGWSPEPPWVPNSMDAQVPYMQQHSTVSLRY